MSHGIVKRSGGVSVTPINSSMTANEWALVAIGFQHDETPRFTTAGFVDSSGCVGEDSLSRRPLRSRCR